MLTGAHSFTYDHVFGANSTSPAELYGHCVEPLVTGLFKGYNATGVPMFLSWSLDCKFQSTSTVSHALFNTHSCCVKACPMTSCDRHALALQSLPMARPALARRTPWAQHSHLVETPKASYPRSWTAFSSALLPARTQNIPSELVLWRYTRCTIRPADWTTMECRDCSHCSHCPCF